MRGRLRGGLRLLVRLELRHLRADARFLLFAAGTDIDEERGFLDRAYQLYLLVFAAVALALSFAQVIDVVGGLRESMGPSAASAVARLLLALLPAAALVAWGVSDLRETPLRMTAPDIVWLARVVRPEELLVVWLLRELPAIALVSALLGVLLGELAGGGHVGRAVALATLAPGARLFALDTALPRSAATRRSRRAVTAAAWAVVGATGLALAIALVPLAALLDLALSRPVELACAALVADLLLLVGAVNSAGRANMAFVASDSELFAARRSLRFLALVDSGAYREACRRRSALARREARRTWRFRPGRGALVSHALASLVRRPADALGLLLWGGVLVPGGALLMVARPDVGLLLSWLLCVSLALREPIELTRVFREDCRCRLVRPLLPFSRLELLLLDSAPALAVTLAASAAAALAASAATGADALPAVLLAWSLDAALLLSAGLDDPSRRVRAGRLLVTGYAGAVLALLVTSLASLFGPWPALACALVADAILMR